MTMTLAYFVNNAVQNSIIFTAIATLLYLLYNSMMKPKNFPPGPMGIPILGVAPFVGNRPEITFANWGKKYGDVIGVKMGNNHTIVLNSYEAILEAFTKKYGCLNNRPDNFLFTDILKKNGLVFADYSPQYIIERRFALATLGKLGFGKTSMEESIIDEADHLVQQFGEGDVRLDTETREKIMYATGNAIARVAFGKRYSDYKDPEFQKVVTGIETFVRSGSLAYLVAVIFPWFIHIPPIRGLVANIINGLDDVAEVIDQKIVEHEKILDVADTKDFIDEYLAEIKKKPDPTDGPFSKAVLNLMIRDLYGAGMDTIEITIIFSCLVLANRPEVMKRIQDEIDEVIGSEGKPHFALKESMPYCHAFILEILRYRTVAPFAVPHCTSENVKFRGYNIPKGTTILPNLYAVHNDPKNWNNPEQFDPERHLDSDGKVKLSKYFVAFGYGPRQCMGSGLALMEIFIFFVTLFQRYSVIPTPTENCERPRVEEDANLTGLTICLPENVPLTLVRRKNN